MKAIRLVAFSVALVLLLMTGDAIAQCTLSNPTNYPLAVTVSTYGAVPNDGIADDAAFAAAFAAATHPNWNVIGPCGGLAVKVPAGVYNFSGSLILPSRPISIRGDGQEITELRFSNGGADGIVGTGRVPYQHMPVEIDGLTLSTYANGGGTAIKLAYASAASVSQTGVKLSNLQIRQNFPADPINGWQTGISLTNVWNAQLSHINIHGNTAAQPPSAGTVGIYITGVSNDSSLSDITIFGRDKAIVAYHATKDDAQGLKIVHLTTDNVNTGVEALGISADDQDTVWLAITNSHINAYVRGLFIQNHAQVSIMGNLIYGRMGNSNFVGIYLASGNSAVPADTLISNNTILNLETGAGAGTSYGIVADASWGGIMNNLLVQVSIGVWVTPGRTDWTIIGNRERGAGVDIIVSTPHFSNVIANNINR